MRIISQNGMIDVPYEMTAIHATSDHIRMNMAGDTGKGTILAEYSTPNKAKKAMEMLREEYRKNRYEEVYVKGNYFYKPTFQFPADEDVEV